MPITGATPLLAMPVPLGSDNPPDGPAAFLALGSAIEKSVVQVFTDATARTAAFTAASITPTEGMLSYLTDSDRIDVYDGTSWFPWLYKSVPRCHAYVSTTQSHNYHDGWDEVRFDDELYDNASMHSTTTNNTRVTAKVAGLYRVTTSVFFAPDDDGTRMIVLRKNAIGATFADRANSGTGLGTDRSPAVLTSGIGTALQITADVQLSLNDYVEVFAYQNSGGELEYGSAYAYQTFLQMSWLSNI